MSSNAARGSLPPAPVHTSLSEPISLQEKRPTLRLLVTRPATVRETGVKKGGFGGKKRGKNGGFGFSGLVVYLEHLRWRFHRKINGEGGIRTLETLAGLLVFETSTIDHSVTSPRATIPRRGEISNAGAHILLAHVLLACRRPLFCISWPTSSKRCCSGAL
jgi:hypothetical protein